METEDLVRRERKDRLQTKDGRVKSIAVIHSPAQQSLRERGVDDSDGDCGVEWQRDRRVQQQDNGKVDGVKAGGGDVVVFCGAGA